MVHASQSRVMSRGEEVLQEKIAENGLMARVKRTIVHTVYLKIYAH